MALGAGSRSVIGLIVRDGFRMVLIGIGAGVVGALLLTRLVSNLIYGVDSFDPLTLFSGMFLLAAIALLACLLPAWKAARIDPMVVLTRE